MEADGSSSVTRERSGLPHAKPATGASILPPVLPLSSDCACDSFPARSSPSRKVNAGLLLMSLTRLSKTAPPAQSVQCSAINVVQQIQRACEMPSQPAPAAAQCSGVPIPFHSTNSRLSGAEQRRCSVDWPASHSPAHTARSIPPLALRVLCVSSCMTDSWRRPVGRRPLRRRDEADGGTKAAAAAEKVWPVMEAGTNQQRNTAMLGLSQAEVASGG